MMLKWSPTWVSTLLEGTEAFDLLGKFVSVSDAPSALTLQIYVSRVTHEDAGAVL